MPVKKKITFDLFSQFHSQNKVQNKVFSRHDHHHQVQEMLQMHKPQSTTGTLKLVLNMLCMWPEKNNLFFHLNVVQVED